MSAFGLLNGFFSFLLLIATARMIVGLATTTIVEPASIEIVSVVIVIAIVTIIIIVGTSVVIIIVATIVVMMVMVVIIVALTIIRHLGSIKTGGPVSDASLERVDKHVSTAVKSARRFYGRVATFVAVARVDIFIAVIVAKEAPVFVAIKAVVIVSEILAVVVFGRTRLPRVC